MRKGKKAAAWSLCVSAAVVGTGMETVQAAGESQVCQWGAWSYRYEGSEAVDLDAVIMGYDYDIGKTTDLEIPDKILNEAGHTVASVTAIADKAFYEDTKVTSVTMPQSVTDIGTMAFWGCSNLKSVQLPLGITQIKDKVFYQCRSLERVDIPGGVETIGDYAFSGCSSLESIVIPESVPQFGSGGENVFDGCKNVTIYTTSGSVAESKAKDWGINVVIMEEEPGQGEVPAVNKVTGFKAEAKANELELSWKKAAKADGYQIQVSTKKSFSGAKTIDVKKSKVKCTISKLKSKTKYYVRIRAYQNYKNAKGKTSKAYGKWVTLNRKTK